MNLLRKWIEPRINILDWKRLSGWLEFWERQLFNLWQTSRQPVMKPTSDSLDSEDGFRTGCQLQSHRWSFSIMNLLSVGYFHADLLEIQIFKSTPRYRKTKFPFVWRSRTQFTQASHIPLKSDRAVFQNYVLWHYVKMKRKL